MLLRDFDTPGLLGITSCRDLYRRGIENKGGGRLEVPRMIINAESSPTFMHARQG